MSYLNHHRKDPPLNYFFFFLIIILFIFNGSQRNGLALNEEFLSQTYISSIPKALVDRGCYMSRGKAGN